MYLQSCLTCVVFQQRTEIGYGSDENPLVMLAWKCHNLKALTYIGKNNALVLLAPYLLFQELGCHSFLLHILFKIS